MGSILFSPFRPLFELALHISRNPFLVPMADVPCLTLLNYALKEPTDGSVGYPDQQGGFNNKDVHKLQRAKDAAAAAVPTAA